MGEILLDGNSLVTLSKIFLGMRYRFLDDDDFPVFFAKIKHRCFGYMRCCFSKELFLFNSFFRQRERYSVWDIEPALSWNYHTQFQSNFLKFKIDMKILGLKTNEKAS